MSNNYSYPELIQEKTTLILHTKRLILAPFTLELAQAVDEGYYDELIKAGYNLGFGWPDEETLETIPKIIKNIEVVGEPTGFESWMIIRKDNNSIIGDIGFKGIPADDGVIDIGYGIIEAERKKGFAVEAAHALIEWAIEQPQVRLITAKCLTHNFASRKILTRVGFIEIKKADGIIYWEWRGKGI
ncbi:anhydro-N-acetylmuramic acid kinase [compost metagenome]